MKWHQLNIEGSIPPARISASSSINDIGTIVFYGGGSPSSTNNYTDLAFMSVGVGVTDEIAKPQNTTSMGKLNKILGSNISKNCQQLQQQQQQIQQGFSKQNGASRKTYSKLPQYSGSTIFHWENSVCEYAANENPGNRVNHSLTSINSGGYKGKILLIGGQLFDNCNNISLSNDIYLLDCESLLWVKCPSTGTSPSPRHSHFVHQISSDTLLLYGGIGDSNQILNDVYLLNLSNQNTLRWSQVNVFGTVFSFKDKNYKVCVCNGFLWVIISEGLEMYKLDLSTYRWSAVQYHGSFPRFQSEYTSIGGCFGSIILLLVENDIFFFDTNPTELVWGELEVQGEKPMKRKFHSVSMVDSMLILVGGQYELPLSTISTRDIEMIDLKPLFIKKKIIK
ncbi:hypothetical protein DICPUDRAFT_30610 [Dictyostelium purpureum]|uniref:Uncharacterized protein n=1 Tax=Dictyostelium purpureum TaxID=5786 RepID=F0ZFL3_DICPU|nr:uncharacterized protein DICPUDRAFT_30610 [Dictyostelium purpureum]EGC37235.1 hypothetical protein DICPUDRAFT_30610 [Dictyostelium purpureum]|eukprot:XP_003286205.1 hypothetical protein DICPUDRAFT_30610 [Dictyostelium purpureum]